MNLRHMFVCPLQHFKAVIDVCVYVCMSMYVGMYICMYVCMCVVPRTDNYEEDKYAWTWEAYVADMHYGAIDSSSSEWLTKNEAVCVIQRLKTQFSVFVFKTSRSQYLELFVCQHFHHPAAWVRVGHVIPDTSSECINGTTLGDWWLVFFQRPASDSVYSRIRSIEMGHRTRL